MVSLRNSLVNELLFNGNAEDTSVNNNDCTMTSASLTTDELSRINKAYEFNGTTDYGTVTHSSELDFSSGEVTVEVFFYNEDGSSGGEQSLVDKRKNGGGGFQLRKENGSTKFIYLNSGSENSKAYVNSITETAWYHIVGSYDGSTIKVYVNGVSDSAASATGMDSTDNDLIIGDIAKGNSLPSAYNLNGKISYVRVWDRALTDEEVNTLYVNQKGNYSSIFDECIILHSKPFNGQEEVASIPWVAEGTNPPVVATDHKGIVDGASFFEGSNSKYVIISSQPQYKFSISKGFSMAGWVNYSVADTWSGFLRNHDWYLLLNSTKLGFQGYDGSNFKSIFVNSNISLDTWYFLVGTWNYSTGLMQLYLDGVKQTQTTTHTSPRTPGDSNFRQVGNNNGKNSECKIGWSAQFTKELSQTEIDYLYDITKNKTISPFIKGVKD